MRNFILMLMAVAVAGLVPLNASGLPAAGSPAPDFRLADNEGKQLSLSDLSGKWVVLYFYPKNFTSGCTLQAQAFQRDIEKYEKAGAVIVGISVDSADSHREFCDKEGLKFTLLADEKAEVSQAYGSVMEYNGAKFSARNSFLIDPAGRIARVFEKVKPVGHSEEVLAALAELQKR
jgi:thioredoxin-dependent peroxiredoxin